MQKRIGKPDIDGLAPTPYAHCLSAPAIVRPLRAVLHLARVFEDFAPAVLCLVLAAGKPAPVVVYLPVVAHRPAAAAHRPATAAHRPAAAAYRPAALSLLTLAVLVHFLGPGRVPRSAHPAPRVATLQRNRDISQ